MEGWIVYNGNDYESWCSVVHANTRGKAKASVWHTFGIGEFLDYSAIRLPRIDDTPITYKNLKEAGFMYLDDWTGEEIKEEEFVNDCKCSICTKL